MTGDGGRGDGGERGGRRRERGRGSGHGAFWKRFGAAGELGVRVMGAAAVLGKMVSSLPSAEILTLEA